MVNYAGVQDPLPAVLEGDSWEPLFGPGQSWATWIDNSQFHVGEIKNGAIAHVVE